MECPENDCRDFDFDFEPAEPSELGWDPYAGQYMDDDPIDPWEPFD
jgi:hypothetical protein